MRPAARRSWLLCVLSALLAGGAGAAGQARVIDYEAFTRRLPNGLVDVGALDLPPEFLRRVSDRSLRSHFRQRFRLIEADEDAGRAPLDDVEGAANPGAVVDRREIGEDVLNRWRSLEEIVPELRGYCAPLFAAGADPWSLRAPVAPSAERDVAQQVAGRLASDGLLRTTMHALRDDRLQWRDGDGLDHARLRAVGIPVDLLACYVVDGKPADFALGRWLDDGAPESSIDAMVEGAIFRFEPTVPGFAILAEDGSAPAGGLRLQVTRPQFARQRGDGSTLDVIRQLISYDDELAIWLSIYGGSVDQLLRELSVWGVSRPERITVVAAPGRPSHWAQDNGKPGLVASDGGFAAVTLVPRFPSRNEQVSKLLIVDSVVFETLEPHIGPCAQSPLHFQGGNVLCVQMPGGPRVLFVGQAEVQRNRALGLSEREVLDALRIEFGVDRCVVLPALSFHLDMEFNVRTVGDGAVACVIDDLAASRRIVRSAVEQLTDEGLMRAGQKDPILAALDDDAQLPDAVRRLREFIRSVQDTRGEIPQRVSRSIVASRMESPAASMARFLLAVDTLAASCVDRLDVPDMNVEERVYLGTLQLRMAERRDLAVALAGAGMDVHSIPCLGDEEAGINYMNAVQLPGKILLPVVGGLHARLDNDAMDAYRAAYGADVEIIPINAGETQRRYGGVHCMVSVYPQVK